MFHYLNNNTFADGETITVEGATVQANTVSSTGASGITGSAGVGAVTSINSGVFYVGGYFFVWRMFLLFEFVMFSSADSA